MNIEDLQELTPKEVINAIKSVNEYQVNPNTAYWIEQYKGKHKILKKEDKYTKNSGFIELQKTVINYQKMIVDLAVAFLFGNPIDLVLNNVTPANSNLFEEFKRLWRDSKTDSTLYKFAKDILIESRGAIKILKNIDNVKHSIINYENSTDFFINFNDEDKADSFEHTFMIDDYDISQKKVVKKTLVDLFTTTNRVIYDATETPYEPIVEETINNKLPIVYAQIFEAEFQQVQNLIDRLEKVISKNGDSNDYFADPRLLINGTLANDSLQKGSTGDVIQINTKAGSSAEVKFLTWDRASESYKMEVEFLVDNIFLITGTPKLAFNDLKGLGNISGVALKLMFLATTIKTKAHIQTTFADVVSRLINVMKNQFTNMQTLKVKGNYNDLDITYKFNDGIPTNSKELIETLVFAKQGGIMSTETAVENNTFVENATTEQEKITADQVFNLQNGLE